MGMYKGLQSKVANDMLNTLVDDITEYQKTQAERELSVTDREAKDKTEIAKGLASYGMSVADFVKDGKVDFVAANEALGKAFAEGKVAEDIAAETKEEKKNLSDRITSAEKDLLKVRARTAAAQRRLEARPTNADFKTELEAATIEQGILEDEINRLNRLRGGEAAPQPQQGTTGQRPPLSDIFGGSR
jgi:flagellin-like hook-associated protein FlgL